MGIIKPAPPMKPGDVVKPQINTDPYTPPRANPSGTIPKGGNPAPTIKSPPKRS